MIMYKLLVEKKPNNDNKIVVRVRGVIEPTIDLDGDYDYRYFDSRPKLLDYIRNIVIPIANKKHNGIFLIGEGKLPEDVLKGLEGIVNG